MQFSEIFRTDHPLFPTLHFDTRNMTEDARSRMRDWIFGNFGGVVEYDSALESMDVHINGKSLGFVPDIRRLMTDLGALETSNGKR